MLRADIYVSFGYEGKFVLSVFSFLLAAAAVSHSRLYSHVVKIFANV